MAASGISPKDRIQNVMSRAVIGLALRLPYRVRVPLVGWVVSTLVAPLAGWRNRVRENLELVVPEMPKSERERISRNVCNNVGRALIEIYSGEEFLDRIKDSPFTGPGVETFQKAREEGRRMVLATAHIGNYDAVRGALAHQGTQMGALYKPMGNKLFNAHYLAAISKIGTPVFPVGRNGVAGLVRHLRDGGIIGIVADVASFTLPVLSFFGHPAHTSLSAAEWALKYDALMIPIFGIRQADGLGFRIYVADPIEGETSTEMMQKYNDVVEEVVRDNIDQWFWIHRRWKVRPDLDSEGG